MLNVPENIFSVSQIFSCATKYVTDLVYRCNRFVSGPVLCMGAAEGRYSLTALPTDSDQWCNVGAYTR
jgi:hypothetical protein